MADVIGRMIELSDSRLVFVGKSERPEVVYVAFRASDGEETKLVLSVEAVDALVELHKNPMSGMPLRAFPAKMVWKRVNYAELETDR